MVKITNIPQRNHESKKVLIKKTVLAFTVLWIISTAFHTLNYEKESNILSIDRSHRNNRCLLVYGTAWKKEKTEELVYKAIENGFRCIDTASQIKHYHEKGVGKGWEKAVTKLALKREDIHLQSKFSRYKGKPNIVPYNADQSLEDQVKESLGIALSNLRTDYLDSYLLHSPYDSLEDTLRVWKEMEKFVSDGKVHALGISNFYDFSRFKEFYEKVTIKPKVLQNRFYDKTDYDVDLRAFCNENGITYQSYWVLTANRNIINSPILRKIARNKNLSPQTLFYAFVMSLENTQVLDGTTNILHMKEDISLEKRILASYQRGVQTILGENDISTIWKTLKRRYR